ncbi:hypothetical protein Tco_0110677 [Tanacetum coccineum]
MHDLREPHFAALKRILRYVPYSPKSLPFGFYDNLLSCLLKHTHQLSSSAEAEYRVLRIFAETCMIRNLLPPTHFNTRHPNILNLIYTLFRDMVKAGHVWVLHVPSRFQYIDIFTKGLPSALFEDFCSSLSVRPPPGPTAGAY